METLPVNSSVAIMHIKVCKLLLPKSCHAKESKLTTGKLIVDCDKFLQFAQSFYDKMGQFSVEVLDSSLDTIVLSFLNSLTRKFLVKKISYHTVFDAKI